MISQPLVESTLRSADDLAVLLQANQKRIVFAESCTSGLVSAIMATVPGISDWLCGSAVTYRESVKCEWLEIDPGLIEQHTAVSKEVTQAMANSVLARTTEADYSVAVTGHLEPSESIHGSIAYIAAGYRLPDQICSTSAEPIALNAGSRIDRQWEAANAVIDLAIEHIKRLGANSNCETEVTGKN